MIIEISIVVGVLVGIYLIDRYALDPTGGSG